MKLLDRVSLFPVVFSPPSNVLTDLILLCVSHTGSFGRVYKGKCRNKIVAIKRYLFTQLTICFWIHLLEGGKIKLTLESLMSSVVIERTRTVQSQM